MASLDRHYARRASTSGRDGETALHAELRNISLPGNPRMKLIFLHGPIASGKLTIARELVALTGFALFHNHLVVDAVASVFPFGSERFIKLREQFWLAMFSEAAEAGRSMIFTFAPETSVSPDFPDRTKQPVEAAGGETIFVRLILSHEEQEQRIGNPDRAEFGKLRSLDLLRELRDQLAACEAAMPFADLTIDTGVTDPSTASRLIADQFDLTKT
jgi:hypothetical protein